MDIATNPSLALIDDPAAYAKYIASLFEIFHMNILCMVFQSREYILLNGITS